MELHQALKQVIQYEGQDILTDLRLINILNDLNAYKEIQGSKYILRAIIEDGTVNNFKSIGKYNKKAIDLVNNFAATTGFNEECVNKIFCSVAFGLGWIDALPTTKSSSTNSTTKSNQQTQASQKLNLTYSQLKNKSNSFKTKYARDAEDYLDGIINILGDAKQELGASLAVNVSFNGEYNSFIAHLEFEGGIKCKLQYHLEVVIVIKSQRGKILSKNETYLDKNDVKRPYFVSDLEIEEEGFHNISEISEIKIYWNKN